LKDPTQLSVRDNRVIKYTSNGSNIIFTYKRIDIYRWTINDT